MMKKIGILVILAGMVLGVSSAHATSWYGNNMYKKSNLPNQSYSWYKKSGNHNHGWYKKTGNSHKYKKYAKYKKYKRHAVPEIDGAGAGLAFGLLGCLACFIRERKNNRVKPA